jgi:hypothetical protein
MGSVKTFSYVYIMYFDHIHSLTTHCSYVLFLMLASLWIKKLPLVKVSLQNFPNEMKVRKMIPIPNS